MHFHTELTPEPIPYPIGLTSRIITLGSCFAEVMGRRLADHKLTVLNNPFGTLFNPVSLARLVSLALEGATPDDTRYVNRDGIWFHYDFHSSLWARSQPELRTSLQNVLAETSAFLRTADYLLLTLGSALVYRHLETDQVVASCHKMPGALFQKYMYSYEYMMDDMKHLLKRLHRANPKLRVIVTVSPVRHTRDTLPLNSASKATLRVVAHELTLWHDWVQYFPAYEIVQDDLRDYRFYEADLVHPNSQAHDYIFEKFAASAFDDELRAFVADWKAVSTSLAHRPLYGTDSSAYQQFLIRLREKLEKLSGYVDVSTELAEVQSRLTGQKNQDLEPGEKQSA